MENPEEILHSLEEFSKLKPKDIPRELEEYLCFVAKTGDPVYQWAIVKSLFREKLISVITEFYESCPSIEVPHCPNVEVFNYESMKSFILEKLDTFVAAPFTVQRICELLTTPRKEYNRIDKYMRALEKNILVVSTTEPLIRRISGNGEGIVNGLESEHIAETNNSNDINVEEMDDTPVWSRISNDSVTYVSRSMNLTVEADPDVSNQPEFIQETQTEVVGTMDSVITVNPTENQPFVSIEPVVSDSCARDESASESDITVTITAIPAAVQKRRDSIEPIVSSVEEENSEFTNPVEVELPESKEDIEMGSPPSPSSSELLVAETAIIEVIPMTETTEPLPSAAESCIIETNNVPLVITPPVQSSDLEQVQSHEISVDESGSLIQIPVISEITSGLNEDLEETSIQSPIVSLHEDSNSGDGVILNDPSESEVLQEVSTSTPEQVISIESHHAVESSVTETKETTVSSTADVNPEVVPELLAEACSQEESSSESIENTSEAEEKQTEDSSLCDVQEFASSSTVPETMDINIEEETCQEAPCFNR